MHVPQTAGIRADFISQNDLSMVAAEFDLEIDELDVRLKEISLQNFVYLERILLDRLNLFPGGELHGNREIGVDQRIAQLVVFIAELDGGLLERRSLRHSQSLGKASCGHIADDDLKRNDLHLLHGRFPVRKLLNIMSRNPFLLQKLVHTVAHLIVDDAFSNDGSLFLSVERCRVVLVIHDQHVGIIRLKYLLCLAFVELFQFFHSIPVLSLPV